MPQKVMEILRNFTVPLSGHLDYDDDFIFIFIFVDA